MVLAKYWLSRWDGARRAGKQPGRGKLGTHLTAEFTEEELHHHRTMLADAPELRLPEEPELRERLIARSELLRAKFTSPGPRGAEAPIEADAARESATVVPLRKIG